MKKTPILARMRADVYYYFLCTHGKIEVYYRTPLRKESKTKLDL